MQQINVVSNLEIHVFSNENELVVAEICWNFWLFYIEGRDIFRIDKFPTGQVLPQEFPKHLFKGTLLFLCYINYLATGLSTNVKLLADDKSLFSVTHDINTSAHKLKMTWLKLNFGMENGFQSRS